MECIGNYEPVRFLGGGSFGDVYEYKNSTTGESVACKKVLISHAIKDDYYPHFRNELLIHSKICHPSVTQLKDILVDKDYIYIIMELCDDGDLNDLVQTQGGLSEDEAKNYFHQVMEAISYIHKMNVAHRDIKLENILITTDGDAKLSDFGLCKQKNGNNPMETTCGTLVYAAPEIIAEQPYDGMKADMWSAGVVLYAMIACHFPWIVDSDLPEDKMMTETARQILEGNIDLPEDASYDLQDLISSLLNMDPDERPTADEVLAHPWFRDIEATPSSLVEPNKEIVDMVDSLITDLDNRRKVLSD